MSEKATKVVFSSQSEIKEYDKEHQELNKALDLMPGWTSDAASFFYHYGSTHSNLDRSAKNFWIKRMNIIFNLDFLPLFENNQYPLILDILKYIRNNRTQNSLCALPIELKYWGGIKGIIDENEVEPQYQIVSLTGLILLKEQLDYQKGYVLTDPLIDQEFYKKDETEFLRESSYKMIFSDETYKIFKTQLDIYHWLIASVSNNPKFKYEVLPPQRDRKSLN